MGCDIHIYQERKTSSGWESADIWKTDEDGSKFAPTQVYEGRNYGLFAILANVRNGIGFAGIKTGERFNVIAEPRGLPKDASKVVVEASDIYGVDGHSHSWLTLRELLDFDWTQISEHQGWCDAWTYARWAIYKRGAPENWSVVVSGKDVHHYDSARMDEEIHRIVGVGRIWDHEQAIKERLKSSYTLVKWTQTYATASGATWWTETIPALLKLADGHYDNVRIVFFFDN